MDNARRRPRALTVFLTVLAAGLLAPALAPASANTSAARRGGSWIVRHVGAGGSGQSADAIAALRASGRLSSSARRKRAAGLARGANRYARTPGAIGKVMLGMAAAGRNGRCVNRRDLGKRLYRRYSRGRFRGSVYDQTLAILGLKAQRLAVPRSAVRYLLGRRHTGGWDFNLNRRGDDVSSTAMAIIALRRAGVSRRSKALQTGTRFILRRRNRSGGFGIGVKERTEANSTALAIQALRLMGRSTGASKRALRGLQERSGAFRYSSRDGGSRTLATNDAVVALSGHSMPVRRLSRRARGC